MKKFMLNIQLNGLGNDSRMKLTFFILLICISLSNVFGQNNEIKTTTVNNTAVIELIKGLWQNTTDKYNFLMFDETQRKEKSAGMKTWDIETFELSDKCLNESDIDNGIETEKDKYISCKESDLCWYIVAINKDFLTLSYMGRGNTLKYKRVK